VTSTPVTGAATDSLTLTLTGLPTGVTAAFAPASIMTNASSMVTFTIPSSVMPGSYPFTVSGASALDNVIHTVSGTLMVSLPPPPDMTMLPDLTPPPPPNNGNGGNGGAGGGTGGNGNTGGNDPGVGRGSAGGCSVAGNAAAGGAWILGLFCVVAIIARRRNA
jgi:MYXO-CTERM domain-containing protein